METIATIPRDTSRLKSLGHEALHRGDALAAHALFLEGMRQDASCAVCWRGEGEALLLLGRVGTATAALEQSLRLAPGDPHALDLLSAAYQMADRFGDSLDILRRLETMGNATPALSLRRASAELNLRLFDAARARLDALQDGEGDIAVRARYTAFPLLLRDGEWARGWDAYEDRFNHGGHDVLTCYPHAFVPWRGEDLASRTLLVHREQGYGDMIMFASALAQLQDQAGQLVVSVPPALLRLFAHSFPLAKCFASRVAEGNALACEQDWLAHAPPIDLQLPFCSLGTITRRSQASFGAPEAYLRPDGATVARFAQTLAAMRTDGGTRLSVGLAWAARRMDHTGGYASYGLSKSVPGSALEPLAAVAGVQWVGLMKPESTSPEEQAPSALQLLDFSWALRDFMDTAGLIAQLDLVITIDSAVAHLAAAMGKETWLLLRWHPDWRWDHEGRASVWYPNVRLFRQQEPGDWSAPLQAVTAALIGRAGKPAAIGSRKVRHA